ncbi:MAG: substrate-binding domain-containing protein [Eubacteriales bacterium]|nr:substrate-binding domain-containing protein [Eubacteriales bacterium]
MKKSFSCIISVLMLFTFASCNNTNNPQSSESTLSDDVSSDSAVSESIENSIDTRTQELEDSLREKLPIINGCSSTYALNVAISSELFNLTLEQAKNQIKNGDHIGEDGNWLNLFENKCDLLLSKKISESSLEYADSNYNTKLKQTPIAKIGYVFLVNTQNPVDSLTIEQIKAIYSGEIKNWKDIGGNDQPITAFQHGESTIQKYIRNLVGKTKLMEPPSVFVPGQGNMYDTVPGVNDFSVGSIGYCEYNENLYTANGKVKAIKINGNYANKQTISDESYPCFDYYYVICPANNVKDSPSDQLIEWLLTDAGQNVVEQAGYIPLKTCKGFEIKNTLTLCSSKGTGKSDFKVSDYYYTTTVKTEPSGLADVTVGENTFVLSAASHIVLPNKALEKEINAYIDDIAKKYAEMVFSYDFHFHNRTEITTSFAVYNGYFSVCILRNDSYGYTTGAIWDMYSGKRLQLSDLFSKNSEFVPQLNERIYQCNNASDFEGCYNYTTRPFAGIESDFNNFYLSNYSYSDSLFSLCFDYDNNSYFDTKNIINFSVLDFDNMVMREARDMKDLLGDNVKVSKNYWQHLNQNYTFEYIGDVKETCYSDIVFLKIENYSGADNINAARLAHLRNNYNYDEIAWSEESLSKAVERLSERYKEIYNNDSFTKEDIKSCKVSLKSDLTYAGDKYVIVRNYAIARYDDEIGFSEGQISGEKVFIYDLQTGEDVTESGLSLLFKDGWESRGKWYDLDNIFVYSLTEDIDTIDKPSGNLTLTDVQFADFASGFYYSNNTTVAFKTEDGKSVIAFIDENDVKYEE